MNSNVDPVCAVDEEVLEIAKLLSRAAKNYQMYLSNNRMFTTSLKILEKALADYLETNDVLTFSVHEFELLHAGAVVYSNTDKYQSIAFRMYRDGVRLLSFHNGITEDDLTAFFEALTRCMETDNLEEDFVTLLWEKDLQAITYFEVNDFEADYETLKKDAEAKRGPVRKISPAEVAAAPWNPAPDKGDRLKPSIALTPEDLYEVRDLTMSVDDDLFLRRACQVFRQTMDLDPSKQTYLDMEGALEGLLDACVRRKQIALASEMLDDLSERYRRLGDREAIESLERIVKSRHDETNMAPVAEVLAGGSETEHEHCRSYLCKLCPRAMPELLRLLPHCTTASARQALAYSVSEVGGSRPTDIVKAIDVNSGEEVAFVLDVLEAIGTEEALSSSLQFGKHGLPRVRAKVAHLAARLGNRNALQIAKSLVLDDDHTVRRRALSSLVEITGDGSTETLIGLFTSNEFHYLTHDSKLSMLLVVRSLSPRGQQEVIRSIMKMRRFFKRGPLEDTKISLLEVIHLMDRETALDEIERARHTSSGRIRKAAETALEKIDHEAKGD
jgi:tetratricopeptide (TPR) repeat protein